MNWSVDGLEQVQGSQSHASAKKRVGDVYRTCMHYVGFMYDVYNKSY